MATPGHDRICSREQMLSGWDSGLLGKSGAGRSSCSLRARGGREQADAAQVHHHLAPRSTSIPASRATSDSVGMRCSVAASSRVAASTCLWRRRMSREAQSSWRRLYENRALDRMFGVARKGHLFLRVELRGGVEQAKDTSVNQIIQVHMYREVLMHPDGDGLARGKMLQHDAMPGARFRPLVACLQKLRVKKLG